MHKSDKHQVVYNILHGDIPESNLAEHDPVHDIHDNDEDDHDEGHLSHKHHKHNKKEVVESFDFNNVESMMWRKVTTSLCFLYLFFFLHLCLSLAFSKE